jgi:hypothetical protein
MNMSLHNSCISYGKSDLGIAYLHEMFDFLLVSMWCSSLPLKSRILLLAHDSSFMSIGLWIVCLWVFIAARCTLTNWSSLEDCLGSVRWFKVRVDLNTLNHLKVIWRTEPIWNTGIVWYFSSIINLNNRGSNETLVGLEIRTSNLQDLRRGRYQLRSQDFCIFW